MTMDKPLCSFAYNPHIDKYYIVHPHAVAKTDTNSFLLYVTNDENDEAQKQFNANDLFFCIHCDFIT